MQQRVESSYSWLRNTARDYRLWATGYRIQATGDRLSMGLSRLQATKESNQGLNYDFLVTIPLTENFVRKKKEERIFLAEEISHY